MRLSTKGRYGARAMLDLALHYGSEPTALKEIARRQEISERYLENIMTVLVASGLATSVRGKRGGFMLARTPKEIRLGDVVASVEGSLAPVLCVNDPELCKRAEQCVTRDIWSRLKDSIEDVLNSISLQDMVEMHDRKQGGKNRQMYFI